MTSTYIAETMPPGFDAASWPALQRARRTVVVVDMVESVRLIEAHEEDTVRRWQQFVAEVSTQLLPAQHGRLVKSLGDGLLCEFASVQPAMQSALAMQRMATRLNDGYPQEQAILLRIGAHTADVIVDALDVYGSGVNLAARLGQLAGPGEIVVSAEVRDHLVPELDADVEDLGDCFMKHVQLPVRAFRVGAPGPHPVIESGAAGAIDLRPTIAVMPIALRSVEPEHRFLGEALADEVTAALSKTAELHVISRLSSFAFLDRKAGLPEIGARLNARYVLSGSVGAVDDRLRLHLELADARTDRIVWADSFSDGIRSVFAGEAELVSNIAGAVCAAVVAGQLELASTRPLPSLDSYTLVFGAIALMHRASSHDFDRARVMLEHLAERLRRSPVPQAWLAKWHVLRVVQGWSPDPAHESRLALDRADRALDVDPGSSLALTMQGLVHAYLRKDFDAAQSSYDRALDANPNESLAWLFSGTRHAFLGEGAPAAQATQHALRLSPLDPLKYFYDSLAASAAISAGDYERAVQLAERSMRANRTHTSTYRAMAIAQSLLGRTEEAGATVKRLLELEPGFTVRRFLDRYPGRERARDYAAKLAEALSAAGLPQ